ncbi:unnamed protein product, partial [Prorocentrum cordatum]
VGEVSPGLPMTSGRNRKPSRSWIAPALLQMTPRPWAGCPNFIAVTGYGGQWPREGWKVDEGWAPGRPGALTLMPVRCSEILMSWSEDGRVRVQWYVRVQCLPYRLYFMRR